IRAHISKERGTIEVTTRQFTLVSDRTTSDKCCSFGFADPGVAMYFFKLRGVDDRTNIYTFVQPIAQAQLLDTWYQLIDQLLADCCMRYDAATGGTALSGGTIGTP